MGIYTHFVYRLLREQCVKSGSFTVLKYLFEHDVGKFDKQGTRVDILGAAVESGCIAMVRYILDNEEFELEHATLCLNASTRARRSDIVELLILHGANFTTDGYSHGARYRPERNGAAFGCCERV